MSDETPVQTRLAILIDADNASPAITDRLLAEVAKYGVATVKRIYGDWTTPSLGGWKAVLLEHSIQPIQQFRYTAGKNATDSALIIDAMDLLYTRRFGGFCLVSSDSDFTRLASRIREEGMLVYGVGQKKTPKAFVSACDKFIFTEVLLAHEESEGTATQKAAPDLARDGKLVGLFRNAIEAQADESGWAELGSIGSNIALQAPEFDPRNYGCKRLSDLAAAIGLFEVDERSRGRGRSKRIYIRNKSGQADKP